MVSPDFPAKDPGILDQERSAEEGPSAEGLGQALRGFSGDGKAVGKGFGSAQKQCPGPT